MKPGSVLQTGKWTIANSGANFLITNPDGTTSTVAKDAALTQNVTIFALPTNNMIVGCGVKTTTAFTGTTTLTSTLGITGVVTACISVAFDMKAAVSNTNFSFGSPVALPTFSTTNLVLALTATVDNISSISAGAMSIWIAWYVLP
jgi:hypothetical protein